MSASETKRVNGVTFTLSGNKWIPSAVNKAYAVTDTGVDSDSRFCFGNGHSQSKLINALRLAVSLKNKESYKVG